MGDIQLKNSTYKEGLPDLVEKESLDKTVQEIQEKLGNVIISLESISDKLERSEDVIIEVTKNRFTVLEGSIAEATHKIWENKVVLIATFCLSSGIFSLAVAFFIHLALQ